MGIGDPSSRLTRRSLLLAATGLASPALWLPGSLAARARQTQTEFKDYPFSLGVASGEPSPDGFVLWTRLAPRPLSARGGMGVRPIQVNWDIALDSNMKNIVRQGQVIAHAETAHSVHAEIGGLQSGHEYFYRFRAGMEVSPIGRVKTLPASGEPVAQFKFASAGCQWWEDGYFTAWRHIAEENLDLVFHYGDYIYEYRRILKRRNGRKVVRTMPKGFRRCLNLSDYRRRYGLYKSDPDLQAAHASCAFLPSFDDHEIANNWADDKDLSQTPPSEFLFLRTAAMQAWYEHMPVRRSMTPRGPDIAAFRYFDIGNLARLAVLDTRQYRSPHLCGGKIQSQCAEALHAQRSMLGPAQEKWLANLLRRSQSTWQVLAQQVTFARLDWRSFPWQEDKRPGAYNMDSWEGSAASRDRVLNMMTASNPANPIVLSGDIHRAAAFELKKDWKETTSTSVGVEFVSSSISSGGDGRAKLKNEKALRADNPHLKFFSNQRGYTRHTVTARTWQADFRVVKKVSEQNAPVSTLKSFTVESGKPKLTET